MDVSVNPYAYVIVKEQIRLYLYNTLTLYLIQRFVFYNPFRKETYVPDITLDVLLISKEYILPSWCDDIRFYQTVVVSADYCITHFLLSGNIKTAQCYVLVIDFCTRCILVT